MTSFKFFEFIFLALLRLVLMNIRSNCKNFIIIRNNKFTSTSLYGIINLNRKMKTWFFYETSWHDFNPMTQLNPFFELPWITMGCKILRLKKNQVKLKNYPKPNPLPPLGKMHKERNDERCSSHHSTMSKGIVIQFKV